MFLKNQKKKKDRFKETRQSLKQRLHLGYVFFFYINDREIEQTRRSIENMTNFIFKNRSIEWKCCVSM